MKRSFLVRAAGYEAPDLPSVSAGVPRGAADRLGATVVVATSGAVQETPVRAWGFDAESFLLSIS
jgi:hypothetical protein